MTGKQFRKGDRVEWTDKKGNVNYGVLEKGGRRPTAIFDGMEFQVKGSAGVFRLSSHPLPKDKPNSMDKWAVKSFREFKDGHGDSPTFNATLYLNGKKVGTAENNGWGGDNMYTLTRENHKKFLADVKLWAEQFGDPEMFEAADAWLFWYVEERLYGVTAEAMISKRKAEFTKGK